MKPLGKFFAVSAIFIGGFLLGAYVQHRQPLGRLRDEIGSRPVPANRSVAELAKLPRARRLVIVAAGQSNAANYGESRAAAGAGVYAFYDGQLFVARDPLPGGDGFGGSIWTRLGAQLANSRDYDAVVFAVVAQGSTSLANWAPGSSCQTRLIATLHELESTGLPVDGILWQQGETEAQNDTSSGRSYRESLAALVATCGEAAPSAKFFVASATFAADKTLNQQIRLAQTNVPGAFAGPNLDELGAGFRHDGIHFNEPGLAAAAARWFAILRPTGTQP